MTMETTQDDDRPTGQRNATHFLPAERATDEELCRQVLLFERDPTALRLLDASLGFAVVLNQQRQIVHFNQAFADYIAQRGSPLAIGSRLGEVLGCVHAHETPGGCGTTEGCRFCGAAQSMAVGLRGQGHTAECRIQTEASGDDLDLLVRVLPTELYGEPFLLLFAVDQSHEKRRRALERIFFHDVTNTAGGIRGIAGLLHERPTEETTKRFSPLLVAATNTLLDEIANQRDLTHAENGELKRQVAACQTASFLRELAAVCGSHAVALGRRVVVQPDAEEITLWTDRLLLARVMGNLLKNALEAEGPGATVTATVFREGPRVVFQVHNPTEMPRSVQLQLFQRSFSTKGVGRGLGTYSVRLLTERYLEGHVSFTSSVESGTTFRVELPQLPAQNSCLK